jgi:hypothetical protein
MTGKFMIRSINSRKQKFLEEDVIGVQSEAHTDADH